MSIHELIKELETAKAECEAMMIASPFPSLRPGHKAHAERYGRCIAALSAALPAQPHPSQADADKDRCIVAGPWAAGECSRGTFGCGIQHVAAQPHPEAPQGEEARAILETALADSRRVHPHDPFRPLVLERGIEQALSLLRADPCWIEPERH